MKKTSIILGAILLLTATNPSFADFRQHYDLGQQYLFNSQYSSSIDEFKKALRINYLDNSARVGIINAYLARGTYYANKLGKYENAAEDFRSALFYLDYYSKNKDTQGYATSESAKTSLNFCLKQIAFNKSPESRFSKADELRTYGKFPAAIYELEQIKSNPKYSKSATAQIADMVKILGNNTRAAEYYQEALKVDPNNGPLLLRYARLLDKLNREDEAVSQYNIALKESDNDPEILYALERIYIKKLDASPKDPELNANIGAIKQKQKDYANALAYYKKAEEYSATSSNLESRINTRLNIGTLFQAQNEYSKALKVYQSILVEFPKNLNANLYTAQCYEAMKKYDEASEYYEKVLSLDPTNSEIRQQIASLKRHSMTPEELLAHIDKHSQVDKGMINMMEEYAVAYHKKKDVNNAIKFYKGVLKYKQDEPDIYTNIALCYVENKDFNNAKQILENGKQRFPNNKTISKTLNDLTTIITAQNSTNAYEAYKLKDYLKAIECYKAITPQTKETYLGIAASYEGLNEPLSAVEYYKKALNLDPNNGDIAYSIGAIYANSQHWDEARTYLEKALVQKPNNNDIISTLTEIKKVTSQIHLQKGAELFNSTKHNEAITYFNKSISDNNLNADAYYYRGMAYDAINKKALAINDYKKAVEIKPEHIMANYLIAVDYDSINQPQLALTFYKKFESLYLTDDEYLKYTKSRIQELAKNGN